MIFKLLFKLIPPKNIEFLSISQLRQLKHMVQDADLGKYYTQDLLRFIDERIAKLTGAVIESVVDFL